MEGTQHISRPDIQKVKIEVVLYRARINNNGPVTIYLFRTICAGMVFSMIFGLMVLTAGDAQARLKRSGGLCGRDVLCRTLEGKKLDIIKYHYMNSALVILYDSGKVGDLILFVPEADYRRGIGTINDAIDFLDGIPEVNGFAVVKGKKSTGWFKTEVIEGLYVVKPQYEFTSESRVPGYRFSDKGGEIIMFINPELFRESFDYDHEN